MLDDADKLHASKDLPKIYTSASLEKNYIWVRIEKPSMKSHPHFIFQHVILS